jgi:SAM-dependent methyltransferase
MREVALPVMRQEDAVWYDGLYDGGAGRGYALRARMEAVVRLAAEGPGDALDVGMGPGRLCFELERRGWTASGVDVSPEMVELARRRLPEASSRLFCASAHELPFEDSSFDLVTATGVLEYAGVSHALSELARVLRPGGTAVLSYPTTGSLYGVWKTRVYYPAARSIKQLLGYSGRWQTPGAPLVTKTRLYELLADVGLVPKTVVPTCFEAIPSPLDELVPRAAEWVGHQLEKRRVAPNRLATQIVIGAERS